MATDPAPSERPVEIVLADDHAVVRGALRALLEAHPDMRVVAEAGDAATALAEAEAHAAQVLLLDLNMPGPSSLEAIAELSATGSKTRVVVLTMESQAALAREALRAGASGYVLKQAAEREIVVAAAPVDNLTEREVEVLGLIAVGHTNSEIASQLDLSVRTVESHRAHIQQKLRLETRPELVRYALDRGLLPFAD